MIFFSLPTCLSTGFRYSRSLTNRKVLTMKVCSDAKMFAFSKQNTQQNSEIQKIYCPLVTITSIR